MSPGIDNQIDWTVPPRPAANASCPSLSRKAQPKPRGALAKRSVMDTLLGENNLVGLDDCGRRSLQRDRTAIPPLSEGPRRCGPG